jgi:hypothetical protein
MGTKFDLNRALNNPFFKKIVITALIFVIIFLVVFFFINKRHHKIGDMEANIPDADKNLRDTSKEKHNDTITIKTEFYQNHTGNGDNINGNKTINNK